MKTLERQASEEKRKAQEKEEAQALGKSWKR